MPSLESLVSRFSPILGKRETKGNETENGGKRKTGSCGIFGGEKGVKNGRMEGWKNTIKPCVHTTERCWDWKKDGRLRVWI